MPSVGAQESGRASAEDRSSDQRVSEAMTVAWMLSFLATLVAELGAVGSFGTVLAIGVERVPAMVAMIPGVLFFVALVTGTSGLLLGWLVQRLREVPAPAALRRASVLAGLFPWLVLVGILAWQRIA